MNTVFALLVSCFIAGSNDHAIYIGVIDVIYNEDKASMELKVFSDDLRDIIRNYDEGYIHGELNDFHIQNRMLVDRYFTEKIQIEMNGNEFRLELKQIEKEGDVHRIYFDMDVPNVLEKLELTTDFFTELFPTQTNIVNLTYNGEKYFGKLTKATPTFSLTLD